MSNVCVLKNGVALPVRTWKEKPVVSYEDIAKVHHMKTERVRLAFTRHKDELLLNEDYFDLSPEETKIYSVYIRYGIVSKNVKTKTVVGATARRTFWKRYAKL